MSNDMRLRGLYFPYARCLSPTFVKQSLLLFDELVFVDPVERIVREGYFYQEQKRIRPGRPRWDSAEEDYRYLEEEGIIRQLNPFPLIRQYDGLMAQAMLCDLRDPVFMELASNFASRDYWGIFRKKIPPGSLLEEALSFSGTRFWRDPRTISSPRDDERFGRYFGTGSDFSSPFVMSVAHDYIPVSCGYSVNTNLALLLAEVEGVTLLTDDPSALSLLNLKYARARKASGTVPSAGPIIARRSPAFLQKYNIVGLNVIDAILANAVLDKISFRSLVEFRKEAAGSLERLRGLLNVLVAKIESEPWSSDFEAEVVRVIESEIVPQGLQVRDEVESTYRKMFGGLIKRTASTVTPTLTVSFLAGLSAGQILTMSCAAVAGALSIALPEIVDVWQDRQTNKKNGLSFLLQLAAVQKKTQ